MARYGSLRALVTPHMASVLASVLGESELPDVLKDQSASTNARYIETAQLRQLCQAANEVKPGSVSLVNLMQGSEISMPPPPQRERNPELVARLERIKAELAQKEYDEMTQGVLKKDDHEGSLGQQYREVTKQTTVILNSFLTVIGSFVFVFFACRYIGLDVVAQVSGGLFAGLLVFFADLYFIMKSEYNEERGGVPASVKKSLAGPRARRPQPALPSKS